jgi:murein DD-endopeptidase MepM/ murein hydrolase activator NlpD
MLTTLLLAATVFATAQGRIVYVSLPDEAGVKSMQINWQNKPAQLARADGKWRTILGIDLDTKTGEHSAEIVVVFNDGRTESRPATIKVEAVTFPTTQLKVEDKYVELSPANQRRSAREARELDAIYSKQTPELLWTGSWRIPVAGQTRGSNFGHRRVFNGQSRAPHAGSDLRAATGTPIHATNRGRVVLAKNLFFTGNTVVLDHGLGVYTIYAHLSQIDVKLTQLVEDNQTIGLAGATGRVTGPHLHWSARIQGARVDPFSLLGIK